MNKELLAILVKTGTLRSVSNYITKINRHRAN
jgi:hypothetical protein